jgi:mRNA interferase HicA
MVVKRTDLIRKINKAAANAGIDFVVVREGSRHSIFRCGSQPISIPRHREIPEPTARAIMRDLDGELGKDWWK